MQVSHINLNMWIHTGNAVWLPGASTPEPWTNQIDSHMDVYVSIDSCIGLSIIIMEQC
jgi:hypothetical protein